MNEFHNPTDETAMPRWAMIGTALLVIAFAVGGYLYAAGYVKPRQKPTPTQPTTPTKSQSDLAAGGFKEASYLSYKYTYKREGEMVIAMFHQNFLPRIDSILVGASKHVIKEAFSASALGDGYLVNSGGVNVIRLDGDGHAFDILPIKEDTGEIHTLRIDRR